MAWRLRLQGVAFGCLCAFVLALCLVPQSLWLTVLPVVRCSSLALLMLVCLSTWPRIPWDRTDWPVFLWALLALPCVFTAERPALAWAAQGGGWIGYQDLVLLGIAWYTVARQAATPHRLRWLRWCILIGTLAAAGFGYAEALTRHSPLYERWHIANPRYQTYLYQHRVMSTQLHPTVLATLLTVLGIPTALWTAMTARGPAKQGLSLVVTAVLIGAMALTFTRFSLIVLVASAGLLTALLGRRRWLIAVAAVVAVATLYGAMEPRARQRFNLAELRHASVRRIDHAALAVEMARQRPWFGVGFNHYRYLYDRYRNPRAYPYDLKIPDNMYFTLLAETGWVGLSGFAMLVIVMWRRWWRRLRAVPESPLVIPLATAGVVWLAVLAQGLVYETLHWMMPLAVFWIWLGLLEAPALDPTRRL